jgi:hypothetical protein
MIVTAAFKKHSKNSHAAGRLLSNAINRSADIFLRDNGHDRAMSIATQSRKRRTRQNAHLAAAKRI